MFYKTDLQSEYLLRYRATRFPSSSQKRFKTAFSNIIVRKFLINWWSTAEEQYIQCVQYPLAGNNSLEYKNDGTQSEGETTRETLD